MGEDKSPIAIFSEEIQSDLMNTSKVHSELIIYEAFKNGLEEASKKKQLGEKTLHHLKGLLKIYGLKSLSE